MTGVSLINPLLVGPTVHSCLVDVLLQFPLHRIALTTDVSQMYGAVELIESDRDYHPFLWRCNPDQPLRDYRMTRITFGVYASPFAANMAVRQNAIDHIGEFPLTAEAVLTSFYFDDSLTGADSIDEAISMQKQLQTLFAKGRFFLRRWNSNTPSVVEPINSELRDSQNVLSIMESPGYTKTLRIEWNSRLDQFRITVNKLSQCDKVTK